MARNRKNNKIIKFDMPELPAQFKLDYVSDKYLIVKVDKDLIGLSVVNRFHGSRLKCKITDIYRDKDNNLILDVKDPDTKFRSFYARDCKLTEKPGIRKKKSKAV